MAGRFLIESQRRDDAHWVTPVGEVDIATATELAVALREGANSDAARVMLDLRSVTFIDSSGLRCVLAAHDSAADNGDKLRIIQGGPQVEKIFKITGLVHRLPFVSLAADRS